MTSVVFVCEHGSAKSVVAAAHFNRIAGERGLAARAVSRGTNPDAALAPPAAAGLEADGLLVGDWTPRPLSAADVRGAARVVTFCPLPAEYRRTAAAADDWSDVPPVSEDYGRARDAIVARIRRLVDEMGAGTRPA